MIEWLYMLIAVLLFGFGNYYRKVASKGVPPREAAFFEAVGYIPVAAIIYLILRPEIPTSFEFFALVIAASIVVVIAVNMVYLAVKEGYVSTATAVFNMNTVIPAVFGFAFLAEAMTPRIVLGILLTLVVIVIIRKGESVKSGKWLTYSLIALVFFGLMSIFNKLLAMSHDPFVSIIFVSIISLFLYALSYAPLKKKASHTAKLKLAFNGTVTTIAFSAMFLALTTVPVSIVAPVVNMNTLVTVLLGVVFLKEKLDRRIWFAIAIALVSVWLLAG